MRQYRQKNLDKCRAIARKSRLKNLVKFKERQKIWQIINRERENIRLRQWRLDHIEQQRLRMRDYAKANRGKVNARTAARRAGLKQATPRWVDREALKQIYVEASKLGLSVDHIVPLNGKNVSGLHVPWNLQLLPLVDNVHKSNKLTTDA